MESLRTVYMLVLICPMRGNGLLFPFLKQINSESVYEGVSRIFLRNVFHNS